MPNSNFVSNTTGWLIKCALGLHSKHKKLLRFSFYIWVNKWQCKSWWWRARWNLASQHRFQCYANDLAKDLVTLDNKVCESTAAALSVNNIESLGQEQYDNFQDHVLHSNKTPLAAPIKRNTLLLYHEKKAPRKTANKMRLQHFRHHAEPMSKFSLFWPAVPGIWRSSFVINLLNTHLRCHVMGPSTRAVSHIC